MEEEILYLLIERAKKGCSDSFAYIFETYQPIVYRVKRVYHLSYFETDDWLQEGRICCYKSIQTYNADRGATFGSFFRMNFKNHVFSLIRRQEAYKRKIDKDSVALKINIDDVDFTRQIIEKRQAESFKYVFYKENALLFSESLSDYERQVFVKHALYEECKQLKDKRALARVKKKFIRHYINQ
ncbi:sigma-70 family RNA polymerase sigma factor [Vagococcus sp. JNUCC 83]